MLFTGLRFHLSPVTGGTDRNRLVDGSPGSDILRRIQIGVLGVTTREAAKRCLGRTVVGVDEPADAALLARIRPADHPHRNPGFAPPVLLLRSVGTSHPSGLVIDEGSELVECPFVTSLALELLNRAPQKDAFEVFQGNPPLRAFCRANDSLADDAVGIGLKPAFSPGDLSQFPPGQLCSGLLENRPEPAVSMPSSSCLSWGWTPAPTWRRSAFATSPSRSSRSGSVMRPNRP